MRVLSMESVGELDVSASCTKVDLVKGSGFLKLSLQRCLGSHREHRASVAVAFGTTNNDFKPFEVEVLDAKLEAFVEPETRSVEQEPDEGMDALETAEETLGVVESAIRTAADHVQEVGRDLPAPEDGGEAEQMTTSRTSPQTASRSVAW